MKLSLNYRRLNSILLILIIVVNSYVITAPLWPQLATWWQLNHTNRTEQLQQKVTQATPSAPKPVAEPNHIIIPAMGLDAPIGEGSYGHRYDVLKNGIWRDNRSSNPEQGGNMILAGHRFTYTNPRGIFYALDKAKVGSDIAVVWNNKQYRYKVSEIKVVPPTDLSIQEQTGSSRLTLFTCTPLYHPTERLVVIAVPVEDQS